MDELEQLRRRQTTRVPLILLATLPLAAANTALQLERWLLAGIAGAVGVVIAVVAGRRVARPGVTNYEFREGDHPAHQAWLLLVPAAVAILAGPLLPDPGAWSADPATVGYTALVALSLTAGWRAAETQVFRVGKRRIRRILACDDQLKDVTPERLAMAQRHAALLKTLASMGAVGGANAWAWKVAELTGSSPGEVVGAARKLERAGLLGLTANPTGEPDRDRGMWLTDAGVRVMAEAGRRQRPRPVTG